MFAKLVLAHKLDPQARCQPKPKRRYACSHYFRFVTCCIENHEVPFRSIRLSCLLFNHRRGRLTLFFGNQQRSHGRGCFKTRGRRDAHGCISMGKPWSALSAKNTRIFQLSAASNEMLGSQDVTGFGLKLFVNTNNRRCTGTANLQNKLSAESSKNLAACSTFNLPAATTPQSFSM